MSRQRKGAGAGKTATLPTREQVLRYIGDNPHRVGKRDIARAFGISGEARGALKAILRDLQDDGVIVRRSKRLCVPGALPPVGVLEITTRDRDGGLLARPVNGEAASDEQPPVIRIIQRPKGPTAGVGDRVLARVKPEDGSSGAISHYRASVIKVLGRQAATVLGIVRQSADGHLLEPAHGKLEPVPLAADGLAGAKPGDLVEVEIAKSGRYGGKTGRVAVVIGAAGGEKAVSMIAIHQLAIPHRFSQAALDEADAAPADCPLTDREDWRDAPLITIDPPDAKDHDDAVFAEPDPDNPGGHIVTVAIADVSWYVRSGSAMDAQAAERGNSVYFPDRVVPMLPERISTNLCSLREGEDRPALAVRMAFDADGRKRRHSFHRVIMRSRAKLSYEQAQAAIDGEQGSDVGVELTTNVLEPLWAAYRCLARARDVRQPLAINVAERKIVLKQDGTVDRVMTPERLQAHRLVEEFMIQANVAAAESLEGARQPFIYRVHDKPSLDKLESLRQFLKTLDLPLARSGNLRPHHFNHILEKVAGGEAADLVNQVVLRAQSQAEYSPDNIGHFGLNVRRYAHFTSPIRRYADLIVHRALIGCLGLGEGGITGAQEQKLDAIAAEISVAERRAVQAERDTADRLIAGFLTERIGHNFHGRINGVTRAGLFVTLDETGADGFVPISTIADEYQVYDAANHVLVGAESGLAFQLGQPVEVRLVQAAPVAGALRFEMLSVGKRPSADLRRQHSRRGGKSTGRRGSVRRRRQGDRR